MDVMVDDGLDVDVAHRPRRGADNRLGLEGRGAVPSRLTAQGIVRVSLRWQSLSEVGINLWKCYSLVPTFRGNAAENAYASYNRKVHDKA